MEMVKIPESFAVQQVKRTQSLQDFISRFEEQMGQDLTERQIAALIKHAEELISAVEREITVATLVLHQLEDRLSEANICSNLSERTNYNLKTK